MKISISYMADERGSEVYIAPGPGCLAEAMEG